MRRMGSLAAAAGAALVLVTLGACGSAKSAAPSGATAHAAIESRSGSKVTGKAVFTEMPSGGTKVEVWVENAYLVEVLDPTQMTAYRTAMTVDNWKKAFGLGV